VEAGRRRRMRDHRSAAGGVGFARPRDGVVQHKTWTGYRYGTAIRASDAIHDADPARPPPLRTPAAHQPAPPRCAFQESRRVILRISPGPPSEGRPPVTTNVKARRVSRLARLLTGRNALRRPVDRIEGVVLVALFVAFLAAVAFACIVGTHTYQSQRAAAVGLRPAAAVVLRDGPALGDLARVGQVEARWFVPGRGQHSGVLTTATTPAIAGASAGTRISVWLNPSGQPVAPPAGHAVMIIYALIAGALVAGLAGLVLLLVYALSRLVLDRRRLAAWESAWDRTGPRWTTRR